MEIPPGTTLPPLPADSGLTLGTAIPASVTGLPQALLRPQVIQAVVLRNSPLLGDPLPPATSSSSSAPTTSPAIPPNPATSGPAGTPTGTPAAPTAPLTAALLQVLAASRASAQAPLQSPPQSPRPAANPAPMQALAAALGATTAPATASPATTAPLPAPTLPAGGRTAPAAGTQLPNLPLLQIPRNPQEPPASGPLIRVALQWQGNTFDVISPRPLPLATPLRIQVTPQNELILRGALPIAPNAPAALTARQQILQAAVPLVRENLPRQQPLSDLLPVLRALTAPQQQAQLPPPLARAILNLWQALPLPRQLQQPQVLQKLLQNSGSFFEANTEQARNAARPDAVARVLGTDLKAQIAVLLTLLNSRASTAAPPAQASQFAPPPSSAQPTPQQTAAAAANAAEMVYRKPQARGDGPGPTAVADDSAETLLQQLGKVLEASLSRIHLNQLDAAVSRHSSADPTVLIPTWVMELPVRTAHGHEQIQVRIEEHTRQQEQQQKRQWVVQLAFDLHDLGKLSATLSIVDRSVAATLWAEQERTHRTVQRELTSLRDGLESVGVNVTEMTCRQGIAPERSGLIRQRLVDTHS